MVFVLGGLTVAAEFGDVGESGPARIGVELVGFVGLVDGV